MKTIALALAVLLVGANAVPSKFETAEVKDNRIVDSIIRGLLEAVQELLQENDPFVVESASGDYSFPVPGVFNAVASVQNFVASGYGALEIDDVSFDDGKLRVQLSLPSVQASVDNADASVNIFNRNINGQISGSLEITDIQVTAEAQLSLTGYLLDDLALDFSVGGFNSNLDVQINGRDLSNTINNWINVTLPATLNQFSEQLGRLFARWVLAIIDRLF